MIRSLRLVGMAALAVCLIGIARADDTTLPDGPPDCGDRWVCGYTEDQTPEIVMVEMNGYQVVKDDKTLYDVYVTVLIKGAPETEYQIVLAQYFPLIPEWNTSVTKQVTTGPVLSGEAAATGGTTIKLPNVSRILHPSGEVRFIVYLKSANGATQYDEEGELVLYLPAS